MLSLRTADPDLARGRLATAAVSTSHDLTLLATALLDGTAPGLSALDPLESADSTNTTVGGFW